MIHSISTVADKGFSQPDLDLSENWYRDFPKINSIIFCFSQKFPTKKFQGCQIILYLITLAD
jgi:hypothetical protein